MAVDNYGIECLKLAAEQVEEGNNGNYYFKFSEHGGTKINPRAKYVEAAYTNSDKTVTYTYYESSSKATLYNTITTTYSVAQDTSFTSAEWS